MKSFKVLIVICCAAFLFCAAGVYFYFADFSGAAILYEPGQPPDPITVIPGTDKHKTFEFTVRLPRNKNRLYALEIHDVRFDGGALEFADMNAGEWEFALDSNLWAPLILKDGERVLETGTAAGRRTLSFRATDNLPLDATGGQLSFQLKLARVK